MRRSLLIALCALTGLALNLALALSNRSSWNVDFNQYYSAAQLVGSGHLYDWDTLRPIELQRTETAVPFGRIPAIALAIKPLTKLPYNTARIIWLGIGIAELLTFAYLWPSPNRLWTLAALCWSAPVAMCLAIGQDTTLILLIATIALRLLLSGQDFRAGLALSLCIDKPHLAILIPVVLIATGKWKAILGGLLGCAAFIALSSVIEKNWFPRLLDLARRPEFDPAAGRMPNLRGLLSFFNAGFGFELAIAILVAAAVWLISRRLPLPQTWPIAIAGSLLLSHHAYFYDSMMLLPAVLLPFESDIFKPFRLWALLLVTPLPYMLLLTNTGLPGNLAISGFTVVLLTLALSHMGKVKKPDTAAF